MRRDHAAWPASWADVKYANKKHGRRTATATAPRANALVVDERTSRWSVLS